MSDGIIRHERLLCDLYGRWLKRNGFEAQCARELAYELWTRRNRLDPNHSGSRFLKLSEQIVWLDRFCLAWERAGG